MLQILPVGDTRTFSKVQNVTKIDETKKPDHFYLTGSSCNCRDKSLPPCPDSGACAAVTCLTGRSCEPCPCNCNIARCVRTALPPFPGESHL